MNTPTAIEILNLWRAHLPIRQAFKTLGELQDYYLSPETSELKIIETRPGKFDIVKNENRKR